MKTEILKIDPPAVARRDIGRIVRFLRREELAVFPTDTSYGLGGNGLSREVIRKVYELKGRDSSKPLLVLVSGMDMVRELAEDIPGVFREVAEEFWPGPLTVIFKASSHIPPELCGGGKTIALRLPDVPWLQSLVREAGFPIIATSANLSGEEAVSSAEAAVRTFRGKVGMIVDGGPTPGGPPSTVLDLSVSPPRIVREGAVPAARLLRRTGST